MWSPDSSPKCETNHTAGKDRKRKRWQAANTPFRCVHCRQMVFPTDSMGTIHRNHCPNCLWSLHVDTKPGNRASSCHSSMEPVGLTFKHNGFDKYGRARTGDIMLVHICRSCNSINLNRIASDDRIEGLFDIFRQSQSLSPDIRKGLEEHGVTLLNGCDIKALRTALLGKAHSASALMAVEGSQ
ncbi:RNHCP domain-containing protein [uncultured Cohaesibacter sp.]|uniref:RNHCP domain-containing protein n=1 Tax=uncultured Cohaesibacter sp. TaxID=1002546 RepID=UPI002931025F|nr:RNHCP domain-containing protein [uncultured Cohaesibacter sp.]